MNKHNEHTGFEKGLRESFNDFSFMPDPAVWNRIEAGLQRKKRLVLYTRIAVAASLLLLFSVTGWLIFRTQDHGIIQQPIVLVEQELKETKETTTGSSTDKEIIAEPASGIDKTLAKERVAVKEPAKPALSPLKVEEQTTLGTSPGLELKTDLAEETDTLPAPVQEALPEETKPVLAEQKLPTLDEIQRLLHPEEFLPEKTSSGSWQLAMGYGTIQGQAISDPSMAYDNTSANFGQDPYSSKISRETSQFSSVENTSHSQPITFGLLVTRNFSDTWGFETGLLYTMLKTTSYTNIVSNEYTRYTSELYYLGIPVSIRLNMIKGRRLGMYISQGAILEKGVRVRYTTNIYASEVLKSKEEGIYMAEGVQVSSLTAIGFDLRLSKRMSLYAQPGLQVFFLNKTQPYNIRSSSAIWPSLQTGLKFQL